MYFRRHSRASVGAAAFGFAFAGIASAGTAASPTPPARDDAGDARPRDSRTVAVAAPLADLSTSRVWSTRISVLIASCPRNRGLASTSPLTVLGPETPGPTGLHPSTSVDHPSVPQRRRRSASASEEYVNRSHTARRPARKAVTRSRGIARRMSIMRGRSARGMRTPNESRSSTPSHGARMPSWGHIN